MSRELCRSPYSLTHTCGLFFCPGSTSGGSVGISCSTTLCKLGDTPSQTSSPHPSNLPEDLYKSFCAQTCGFTQLGNMEEQFPSVTNFAFSQSLLLPTPIVEESTISGPYLSPYPPFFSQSHRKPELYLPHLKVYPCDSS